jgi:hypothetical protein
VRPQRHPSCAACPGGAKPHHALLLADTASSHGVLGEPPSLRASRRPRRRARGERWQRRGKMPFKLPIRRTGIKPILPGAPRLQCGVGNLKPVGGLTLGDPLGLQVAILFEEGSTSEALPALVTINMAPWLCIHDSAHSSLLTQPS